MSNRFPGRFAASLLAAGLAVGGTASAQDAGPSPVRMDPDKLAGLELTPIPNDAFIVPKGYNGTWEQHGDYRELAVIARPRE